MYKILMLLCLFLALPSFAQDRTFSQENQSIVVPTGKPTFYKHRYEKIELKYIMAPGLAQILGGKSLFYFQMDPWNSVIKKNYGF